MEDAGTVGLTIAVVVGVTALLTFFQMRKRSQSWEGVVLDIKRKQVLQNKLEDDEAPNMEEYVVVHYRTDAGSKSKFQLKTYHFDQQYAGLKAGDRLIKRKGEYMPQKL